MPTSAQEVYRQIIHALPATERLRLATLILNELVEQGGAEVDENDVWSEQDQIDVLNFSLQYAATAFPEDEDVAS
jgi:hypothetical protein